MNFALSYSGAPGFISATLTEGGYTVATATNLEDRKAVEKWAAKAARDWKVDNTPDSSASHCVVLSGNKTFSL